MVLFIICVRVVTETSVKDQCLIVALTAQKQQQHKEANAGLKPCSSLRQQRADHHDLVGHQGEGRCHRHKQCEKAQTLDIEVEKTAGCITLELIQ